MIKKFLKEAKEKAKETLDNVELKKIEEVSKDARKKVQEKLDEQGVTKVIDKIKKETTIVGKAISESAEEIYNDNKETLEKPVETVSNAINKVSKHSEELKWAGGIIAAFVAPVPTLVASTAIFFLSKDEEDLTEEEKIEKEKLEESLAEKEVMSTKTSLVELVFNRKTKVVYGKILTGSQENKTFEELGVENMTELQSQLDLENPDHKATHKLIEGWLNWKKKNN